MKVDILKIWVVMLFVLGTISSGLALTNQEKMQLLEEKFLKGEVSEKVYLELKEKYEGPSEAESMPKKESPDSTVSPAVNIAPNPGFEKPNPSKPNMPYWWRTESWHVSSGKPVFIWDDTTSYSGKRSVCIECNKGSTGVWVRNLWPSKEPYIKDFFQPGKVYRVSVWVKAENVSEGAILGIDGFEVDGPTRISTFGTHDWKQIVINGAKLKEGTSTVGIWFCCRGGDGGGKVWFDDVEITETAERMTSGQEAVRPTATSLTVVAVAGEKKSPFSGVGLRAFVVRPENSWKRDSTMYGALQERGFDVSFGSVPSDLSILSEYDLVALNIRQYLAPAEVGVLKDYVARGGAVYGSLGGPRNAPGFLREVCGVAGTQYIRLTEIDLVKSPLSEGLTEGKIAISPVVGDKRIGIGWDWALVTPIPGGQVVAVSKDNDSLGVLNCYGKGRTAILGFEPEQTKYFVNPEIGQRIFDNLLTWLLESRIASAHKSWSNEICLALPVRAEILEVSVNSTIIPRPKIKEVGSLKKVCLDIAKFGSGQEFSVRITYKPLSVDRNVETFALYCPNVLPSAAGSPSDYAEYLKSMNATMVWQGVRNGFGKTWYKGTPADIQNDLLVKQYQGDFLTDLISECHKRGLKFYAGMYLDNATPVRTYPEVIRYDANGNKMLHKGYNLYLACFNNPKAQEYNLKVVEQFLQNYPVDGLILDDNFELDKSGNWCYCPYCLEGFRSYCKENNVKYLDPRNGGPEITAHWVNYRRLATLDMLSKFREIAVSHRVPFGGWVSAGMDSIDLKNVFDLVGGMIYTQPMSSLRGPLDFLDDRKLFCAVWSGEPGGQPSVEAPPEQVENEIRKAIHAGAACVGVWLFGPNKSYRVDEKRAEAIRRAFGDAETEWFDFYKNNLITGDGRFAVTAGRVTASELSVTVRNTGKAVDPKQSLGNVDFIGLK